MPDIKTAPYFTEVVLRKRPYLTLSIVAKAIATAEVRLVQSNGRIRLWSRLEELNGQALRVVLCPME